MSFTFQDFREQGEQIGVLESQIASGKLIHALMISGERGTGKKTLAFLIARALLCTSEGARPCGECTDCRLAEKREHPDLIVIQKGVPLSAEVKKDRATIPVEDIREMIRMTGVSTLSGRNRVVVILDADKMTPQAQNCLLKTIEEPPENTVFLLVTDQPGNMLTTVISRCRMIRIHPWSDDSVCRALLANGIAPERAKQATAAANGSIGTALELAGDEEYWEFRAGIAKAFFGSGTRSDILKTSNQWKDRKQEADRLFSALESLLRNLLLVRTGRADASALKELYAPEWVRFAQKAGTDRFTALFDAITAARKQAAFAVNFQALLEQLLFTWMEERTKWSV